MDERAVEVKAEDETIFGGGHAELNEAKGARILGAEPAGCKDGTPRPSLHRRLRGGQRLSLSPRSDGFQPSATHRPRGVRDPSSLAAPSTRLAF